MSETIKGIKRSHMCGILTEEQMGQRVTLMGWSDTRRDLGGLIFIDLRDRTGIIQVVFDAEKCPEYFKKAEKIRNEYVIAVVGEVVLRDAETVNPNIDTGKIEVAVEELRILNAAKTPPVYIEENSQVSESVRLKYRYIDLRRPDMQRSLMLRHSVAKAARDFLDENEFIEIETPMLTRSTPEGARDYLVPSRVHSGSFYALPQSPQLFKQLLMVSGMDKYFQIVKCFRDEDLRADRQPEFTQIDIEMSFVDVDDIIRINEKMMGEIFSKCMSIDIKTPFKRLTYQEAMQKYGNDKPDTRFDLEINEISDIVKDSDFKVFSQVVEKGGSVRGINAKGCDPIMARREIDSLVDFVKEFGAKGLAWINLTEEGIKSPIAKFFTKEQLDLIIQRMGGATGDILMFVADNDDVVFSALSHLRLKLGHRLELIDENKFEFLWITDFPLLEYDKEEKRYTAVHHPFTSPMDEDLELLDTHPEKVRAKAYDLVLNGVEVGGGSIRIHNAELQEKMFKALGFTQQNIEDRFGFLTEAFKYGTPPHGGIAYGLDRLIMLLAKKNSIRDVIAFPKVQNASCPMTDAPSMVDDKQLEELHISVVNEEDDIEI